jgi:hypothetical protein
MERHPDLLSKLPPQSIEVEQGVLGAILLDQEALIRVLDILHEQDFYQDGHRWIFRVMVDLFEDNAPIDVLTVSERLKKQERLDNIGGSAYLAATMEAMLLHVNDEPRTVPMPPEVLAIVEATHTAHTSLPIPEQAGQGIGLRRK